MYEVHACGSPNVIKVIICLAELGQDWREIWVDVTRDGQHDADFLRISPNGRVPVLVDHAPSDGGEPAVVWESGAILAYLAEKHGQFLPPSGRGRSAVMTWLFWQMAGLGPMSGQNAHFLQYDPPGSDYAQNRYHVEVERLYRVLDRQLAGRDFICGDYSIADMACYPWVRIHRRLQHDISGLPALEAWAARMGEREGVARAYARMQQEPAGTASRQERWDAMRPERGLEALAGLG